MTRPSLDEIIVAFGVDSAYTPHLATVIASVVANSPGQKFRFMIIHDGIPLLEQQTVQETAPGEVFQWCDVSDSPLVNITGAGHVSGATYYRLAIPDFTPPGANRVIYLDSDLIVLGDLRELWSADLQGMPIGAVHDGGPWSDEFARKWALEPVPLGYFNAGVLILDVDQIRDSGMFAKAVHLLQTRREDFPLSDQDVLNLLAWGKWHRVDPRWNTQRRMLVHLGTAPNFTTPDNLRATHRPKIIHYTEAFKPWLEDAWHPLTWFYFRYLRRTPYWTSVLRAAKVSPFQLVKHYIRTNITWSQLKS